MIMYRWFYQSKYSWTNDTTDVSNGCWGI